MHSQSFTFSRPFILVVEKFFFKNSEGKGFLQKLKCIPHTKKAKNERYPSIFAPSIDGVEIFKLRTTGCTNQKACSYFFNFGISNQYL